MAFIGAASLGNGRQAFAISDDGRTIVYVGERQGTYQLYLRPIDSYEAGVLPGTEGAYNPFFSPDGRWIGFFVGNEVKKVAVEGGAPVTLATIINPMGADWGSDDRIYVGHEDGNLYEVLASGDGARIVRPWDGVGDYLYPTLLPEEQALLTGSDGAWVSEPLGGPATQLRDIDSTNPRFL